MKLIKHNYLSRNLVFDLNISTASHGLLQQTEVTGVSHDQCHVTQAEAGLVGTPGHLITATESAWRNIKEKHKAEALRSDVAKAVMKQRAKEKRSSISLEEIQHITGRDPTYHWKRSNISLEERKALHTLRSDKTIKILPADKGRAMVIMKATEYDNKIAGLLENDTTYTKLERDPTKVN